MAYPKSLRNRFHVSIAVFADLINCSASQLSMAESGKRQLPTESLILLGKLEAAVLQKNSVQTTSVLPDAKQQRMLDNYIRPRVLQLDSMKQKANQLAEKKAQAEGVLQLAAIFEESALVSAESIASLQSNIARRQAQKKLIQYHQDWMKVQLVITGLEAEIKRAEELKNI